MEKENAIVEMGQIILTHLTSAAQEPLIQLDPGNKYSTFRESFLKYIYAEEINKYTSEICDMPEKDEF